MIYNSIDPSSNRGLGKTKARLSAIFTLVVFSISIILIGIFLTYKYNSSIRAEKTFFLNISEELVKGFNDTENFSEIFNSQRGGAGSWWPSGRRWPQESRNLFFTNFLILDSETNSVVFANINRNFDTDTLAGRELKNGFFIEDSIMVRVVPLTNLSRGQHLVAFREVRYSFQEYIADLLKSFLLAILSSIVFYIIWRKFVAHTLKPVEENIHDMQDFIHNAGHELKTPLSVIHGNLQFLKATKKFDAEIHEESIQEVEKLNKLIESLVDLSSIQEMPTSEKINLQDEMESTIKDFSKKADKKNIKIHFTKKANTQLKVHREYFYILFSNLLWNAIKYSHKDGKIEVILRQKSFEIQDNWIGIPKEKQDKIFGRFYKAHDRNTEWYGIWLSLVRKIVHLYKWKISVDSVEEKGTTVKVSFK